MTNKNDFPECFGTQGMVTSQDEAGAPCPDCAVFEKCHKLTVAACLNAICSDIDLIVQNGLIGGSILSHEELEGIARKAARRGKHS